jgi:long-chain acyl-CoA synthetase
MERVIKEVNQRVSGYKKITRLTILDEPMDMTSTKKIKRNKVTA